jgi:hypothetical protein
MVKIIDELKQTTAAQLFRHATTVGMIITPLWLFSGPFVKAYASDALLEVLKQQGIDPQAISEMKSQGIQNGNSIKNLDEDADKIRGDLNAIKQQVGQVANQIQEQTAQSARQENLLNKLLELQLRKTDATP